MITKLFNNKIVFRILSLELIIFCFSCVGTSRKRDAYGKEDFQVRYLSDTIIMGYTNSENQKDTFININGEYYEKNSESLMLYMSNKKDTSFLFSENKRQYLLKVEKKKENGSLYQTCTYTLVPNSGACEYTLEESEKILINCMLYDGSYKIMRYEVMGKIMFQSP